jgi:hypothetical protein
MTVNRLLKSLPLLALVLLASCGDSGITVDLTYVTVETVVDRTFLNAGSSFSVACIVTDPNGREIKTDTAFRVEPGKSVLVQKSEVTPGLPGLYTVTCMLPDESNPDSSPETVLVTRKNISKIETKLDSNEAAAGTDVDVTCTVLNESGDEVSWDTEVTVAPAGGIAVNGHTLTTEAIGTFEVACAAVGLPIVDDSPEILDVSAGEPVKVRATIKETEVEAGTEVPVFCTVEDEFENALEFETVIDPQAGYAIDGHTLITQLAGAYDITCSSLEFAGLEQISDHLIVTAGPIASLILTPKPKKNAYKVGDKVEILAHAADINGNPLEGDALEVVIVAPAGMKEAGEKFEFLEEGSFTFTGNLPAPNEDISGELTLICDENGPDIVLFTPERAATLTGETMVDVEGNVTDLFSTDIELEINDTSVPIDDSGNFFHIVEGAHGMNILALVATDEFGNSTKHVQSFYYSTAWMDYASELIDDVILDESLLLFLGQNFLDDGDHDPQNIDDVATLVQILLDNLDLQALLPPDQPVLDQVFDNLINVPLLNQVGFELSLVGDLGLKVYIEEVSFSDPFVAINTRDGGIDMTISFIGPPEDPGLFLQLTIELNFNLTVESKFNGNDLLSVGINPGVAIQSSFGLEGLLVETSLDIAKEPEGDLSISVADLNIVPSGFHIELLKDDTAIILGPIEINGQGIIDLGTINLGQLGFMQTINDFLSNNLIDPILDFVVPAVLDLIEPLVEDQVTNLLEGLLSQFELELPIPLPQLPGADSAVTMNFKTKLSSVKFLDDGGHVGLSTGFMAPKGVEREVLGCLLRDACGGSITGIPEFDSAEKFAFAAMLDMVNELLFSLWWGGGLQLELDESVLGAIDIGQYGITDLGVKTDFLLAPILDDCTAKGMVEVQLGDLLVTLSFKLMGAPLTMEMYVSAALDAVIFGDGNEIGLKINGITDIGTHILNVEGDLGPLAGMFDIEQLVEGVLIPMVVEQVANLSLGSFPIPEIDLSGLIPGIPPGTSLTLGNLVIEMNKGYLLFGGELL